MQCYTILILYYVVRWKVVGETLQAVPELGRSGMGLYRRTFHGKFNVLMGFNASVIREV